MTSSIVSRLGTAPEEAVKAPVVAATTANITLSGLQTIDGVSVSAGDRVMVKDQTDGGENGIYNASETAWKRATDWNANDDVVNGVSVLVAGGDQLGLWMTTFTGEFSLGSTATVSIANLSITTEDFNTLSAQVTTLLADYATLDTQLAAVLDGSSTAFDTTDASIAVIAANAASNTSNITTLTSSVAADIAALEAEAVSLLSQIQANDAADSVHDTDIVALETIVNNVTSGNSALATALTALDTRVTTAEGSITTSATDITALTVVVDSAQGDVNANASAVTALDTRVTTAEGNITSSATDITALETIVNDVTSGNSALATAATALTTRVTTAEGNITSGASQLTSLTTVVNGNTASATSLLASVNGLEAEYGIALDVNGNVSGISLTNDGTASAFNILADSFAITDATTAFVPFAVTGGVVYMQDVVIGDALISDLSIGTLTSGEMDVELDLGADGLIIHDNGVVMKVSGLGFGTTGQFIEWFGTSQDPSLCNEADGLYWVRMDGNVKFPAYTAAAYDFSVVGTDTAANAEVTLGEFATSGATKTITLDYNLFKRTMVDGDETTSAPLITLKLYRKIGAGAETEVASVSEAGTCTFQDLSGGEPLVYDWQTEAISAGIVYTDNDVSTDNRTFRVAIFSRTLNTFANYQSLKKFTQTMALDSTET